MGGFFDANILSWTFQAGMSKVAAKNCGEIWDHFTGFICLHILVEYTISVSGIQLRVASLRKATTYIY